MIVTVMGFVLIGATHFLGDKILSIVFSQSYVAYANYLPWAMVAGLMIYVYSILGISITAARYFRIQPFMLIAAVVVTAVLSLWLIPEYGIQGAILTMIGSGFFQIIVRLVIIFHLMKEKNNKI